jgi:hypothetical protein
VWFPKICLKLVDLLAADLCDFNSVNMYREGMMEESKKYVRTEEINRVKNKQSGNFDII